MDIHVYTEESFLDGVLHNLDPGDDFVGFVLCFPEVSCKELADRINKLALSGFTHLIEYGGNVLGYRIIGKGYSSINVLALNKYHGVGLLKLRRLDSRRKSLELEGFVLDYLEKTGYVPRLYTFDQDFVFREYLTHCSDYVNAFTESLSSGMVERAAMMLKKLFYALYLFDRLGVDHGELARPYKHIYWCEKSGVSGVKVIDWESSSFLRRPHNLTAFASFLLYRFRNYEVARAFESVRNNVLELLKKYRDSYSASVVEEIVKLLEKQLLTLQK